jgi:protein-disulfide isomerase
MRRAFFASLLILAAFAAPAEAADPSPAFTPEQKQQIVDIVRAAMKSDPSILRDAVVALQAEDQAREAADTKARLASHEQALTGTFGDPVAGNPNGDVTLVEFYDPRCPYCRRMLPAIASLLQHDPKLRLVYKDIPVLGPGSVLETRAILAAQHQGAYERMQQALMRNPAQPSDAMIRDTAQGLGLDAGKLMADMNSPAVTAKIEANLQLARDMKVEGTPIWFVGQTQISGAVDEGSLAAAVAKARAKG